MEELKIVEESDVAILASPVYCLNVTTQIKTFIQNAPLWT